MGANLDAGAHPGPMGSWMPMGIQSPHALRCTYGWLLPCLLNYCSAGPWVAAAAPPHSPPFSVPLPGGLRFLGFGRCCTLDSCDQAFVNSDAVSRASALYSADESEVVARILSFCCSRFFCGGFLSTVCEGGRHYASSGLHMWLLPSGRGSSNKKTLYTHIYIYIYIYIHNVYVCPTWQK